jgi:CDP-diacylglycerol--glycerol-3-phosphate 3-phosphatidyltransferase
LLAVKAYVVRAKWWGFNLADWLSLSRPILAILAVLALYFHFSWVLAAASVGLIALTDYLDGQIARRCHLVSPMGARLDETNDKIAMTILFGFFVYWQRLSWPIFVLFLLRELLITGFRSRIKKRYPTIDLSAKLPGKIKTCLQFALAILLCLENHPGQEIIIFSTTLAMLFVSYTSAAYIVYKTADGIGKLKKTQT